MKVFSLSPAAKAKLAGDALSPEIFVDTATVRSLVGEFYSLINIGRETTPLNISPAFVIATGAC